jgi:hypothetical protein
VFICVYLRRKFFPPSFRFELPASPQSRPQLGFAGDIRDDRRGFVAPVDALRRGRAVAAEDADVGAN